MSKCSLFPEKQSLLFVLPSLVDFTAWYRTSKRRNRFYQHLEMFLRQESTNLCQRDHLSYRSYFQPVKCVVDGDLCERYSNLPPAKQQELAQDIGRTPVEITKKLETTRTNIL